MNKLNLIEAVFCLLISAFICGCSNNAATPQYELSKKDLVDFVNTRYKAYFHINMCTFKNLNSPKKIYHRTDGNEPPTMWNPTGMDCEQWADAVIAARMTGGWLTTKHHGGFCLWDSKYTDFDVASSNVKTDVVKLFVEAFRKKGLKVGLYYSILDYHHGIVNGKVSKEEIEFLKNQITELLTDYGPIDYINFDGWSTWPTTPTFDDIPYYELFKAVKAAQPNCLIISHVYESNLAHTDIPFTDAGSRSYPLHPDYMRPAGSSHQSQTGWFWNKKYRVKRSIKFILKNLNSYNSHNAVYILNLGPGPDGRIQDDAIERVKEVAAVWRRPADLKLSDIGDNWGYMYDVNKNLAFLKPVTQSSTHKFILDRRAYPRAEIAIDGVTEGNLKMEQTSYTKEESQPWWQVDLVDLCDIDKITIYNRTDAEMDRLSDYNVYVLGADGKKVWSSHQTTFPNPSVTLSTGCVTGRFVKIQLTGKSYLHLAEVIVEGKPSAK